jgi:DnaJ family protein C protein 7
MYIKAMLKKGDIYLELEKLDEALKIYMEAHEAEPTHASQDKVRKAKLEIKKAKRKNYYKMLGVEKNATGPEIKKAYRKSAVIWHPDKHSSGTDAEKENAEI